MRSEFTSSLTSSSGPYSYAYSSPLSFILGSDLDRSNCSIFYFSSSALTASASLPVVLEEANVAITREYRPKFMATGLVPCYYSTSDYSSLVEKRSRQFPTVSSKAAVNLVRLVHSIKELKKH